MEARQVRANIYLQLDRAEEALEECKEVLKLDPEYNAAIFTLAQAYKKLKRYDEAIAGFNRALQLDPRDPKPLVCLGEIYLETKDLDKAIAAFEEAISIDPQHSSLAHNNLGAALLEKKMLERVEQEILKALEIRPRIPDAHHNLGLLAEAKGDIGRAIEEFKKEIYADKSFARAYLFLAKAYLDLDENFAEAIQLAKKGLELDPEAESAPLGHYVLADIYYRLGRSAEYAAELEKDRRLEKKLK
jgi:tetratricopeptide (TPR) repeat protein